MKYTDELKDRAVERVVRAQADPDVANGANTQYVVVTWCDKTRLHPSDELPPATRDPFGVDQPVRDRTRGC